MVPSLATSVVVRAWYLRDKEPTCITVAVFRLVTALQLSYGSTLNLVPTPLRAAEARARQELPPDARVLWRHTFGGTCAQEQFRSATLAAVLGDGQVNVEFDNAVSSTVTPVTEGLFSTYDASTVAQAPHC